MIQGSPRGRPNVALIGAVRGLVAESAAVVAALDELRPEVVGVGVSFEELTGLRDYFVGPSVEPLVPLTTSETAEARALTRFGPVGVPHPAFLAGVAWAESRRVTVEPLDPSDESFASSFAENVSYLELVRRTLRERNLARQPPESPTAEEFAVDWDLRLTPGAGSARLTARREQELAESVERLSAGGRRVVGIVDYERYAGVMGRLESRSPDARAAP
ncbi:MAG TPA: hypothetical protein VFF67_04905 [Thermoplasmata archaeon]|nr:hypothetical protein [Thermoplasmata archaeon]